MFTIYNAFEGRDLIFTFFVSKNSSTTCWQEDDVPLPKNGLRLAAAARPVPVPPWQPDVLLVTVPPRNELQTEQSLPIDQRFQSDDGRREALTLGSSSSPFRGRHNTGYVLDHAWRCCFPTPSDGGSLTCSQPQRQSLYARFHHRSDGTW
jgi:hypothetical protein